MTARFALWQRIPRLARQILVAIVGTGVLAVGLAMVVLPGPAVVVIPLGLAILSTEFIWARKLLHAAKARLLKLKQAALDRRARRVRGAGNVSPVLEGADATVHQQHDAVRTEGDDVRPRAGLDRPAADPDHRCDIR